MSLQFIIGGSGTGKSQYIYQNIIKKAVEHPERLFYVIVPEQFTMQTQRTLVDMSPGKGILNIDILSFERLAYRVLQETGGDSVTILEETGKSMVLQKIVQKKQGDLVYLGGQMKKQGYLNEMKSMISELMQYDIQQQELLSISEKMENTILKMKLKDVGILYEGFREYLEGNYITNEEVMDILVKMLPFSEKLKNSEIVFDGFTGFTPIQVKVIGELLYICNKMYVTVTMDGKEDLRRKGKLHHLFYMSHEMIRILSSLTKNIDTPVLLFHSQKSRFAQNPALEFLEQNLFRYTKDVYDKEQDSVQIFAAGNPESEIQESARQIHRLIRLNNYRYGEIAVITGNMDEYKSVISQVFTEAGIPFFMDETHTILMNPFIEYMRASIEMILQNFTYESVFRYLRCGMSNITREETDQLENYIRALGIKGIGKWKEPWVRVYKGMEPQDLLKLNEIRECFMNEIAPLYQGFQGEKKTVGEYCSCLYYFIVECKIQEKLKRYELEFRNSGNKAMEKEYNQIYGIVMNLLDKMVEILGEQKSGKQEFRQLLEAGLEETKVALVPPNIDQILVGDIERTRLKDIKALFFVGVNEGNIPKNKNSSGVFTEMDREALSDYGMILAPGSKELMNIQRFYLYLNLTKPKELLYLSYSTSNSKGEAISPAYLIHNIKQMFPKIHRDFYEVENFMLDQLETPETSIASLLQGLQRELAGEQDMIFYELFSWYLRKPEYKERIQNLIEAAFKTKPDDVISKSVAKALYGDVSPYNATRLEKYAACAFAHFLKYGMQLTERVEYEFHAMDMGNIMHKVLEAFSIEVKRRNLVWANLTESDREQILEKCMEEAVLDYGNTILKSSARNEYIIQRTKRILKRTIWALQEQLKNGEFQPEGFEISFGGGRIDRVDTLEDENKVYVKVIDYKTGNTSFNLVSVYYGLQMQLVVYLDGAMTVEQKKHPDKEIVPAGIFYYNVKDPLIKEKMETDIEGIQDKLIKELKMNGLVQADADIVIKLDKSLKTIPVAFNKDGSFRKNSSVATAQQFRMLKNYVKNKIDSIREEIMEGNAQVSPYLFDKKNPCTYCAYSSVCGFDRKIPGHEFRNLNKISDEEVWRYLEREDV